MIKKAKYLKILMITHYLSSSLQKLYGLRPHRPLMITLLTFLLATSNRLHKNKLVQLSKTKIREKSSNVPNDDINLVVYKPCSKPNADPGRGISPIANFRRLVSLELGLGLGKPPVENADAPRPVSPSKLDCLKLAQALEGWNLIEWFRSFSRYFINNC